jgi:biopolymer transport protein ExbD
MNVKSRRRTVSEAEVPLSSMIDVVFLLLIYFIVTQQPILENVLLKADLPSRGAPPERVVAPLVVDVRKVDGEKCYGLMGRRIEKGRLFSYLRDVAGNDPNQEVVINCGPNARHSKLVGLLDACAEIGLKKLNIVNDESVPFEAGGR